MSNLGLVQGFIGNPFGSAVEGPAFGVLNDVLSGMRSKDGIARPARYEVVILPPRGSPSSPDRANLSKGVRETSLKCENIAFPGRTIDSTPDTNIYGPTREIVNVIRGLSGMNLISADVVLVSPAYDHAEVTLLAAATIVYELTNLFAKK